jgi:hypothetical protein
MGEFKSTKLGVFLKDSLKIMEIIIMRILLKLLGVVPFPRLTTLRRILLLIDFV